MAKTTTSKKYVKNGGCRVGSKSACCEARIAKTTIKKTSIECRNCKKTWSPKKNELVWTDICNVCMNEVGSFLAKEQKKTKSLRNKH